ncbi:MAG: glycosyltransferase [Gallionella sp.]|nr:glycosyltransferase [Gallionella sp.]
MTSWLPASLQKYALWALAELFQSKHALLSEKEGMARLESAKRFLQDDNVLVLFQSPHQHQLFERAIGGRISVRTSLVIPANRDLIYESEKDTRRLSVGKGKIIFMFAARASFDRGLHFLLDAWSELTHRKNMLKLVVRCDAAGERIERQVARLQENGFDIDMVYGKLDDQKFVDLHRQAHFVVNPAMWEEPLAGSVIEGFDLGTPAIVPTRTGSSCFVKSGWNGYSYEFRDKVSLLKCLEMAVENINSWEHLHNGALATSRKYRRFTNLQLEYIRSVITPDPESRTIIPSGAQETVQDGISTLRK